jgi:hypothetical protein
MKNQSNKVKTEYKASHITNGLLYEMIYDQEIEKTSFISLENGELVETHELDFESHKVAPFPATYDLIKHKAILFPSLPIPYGSEAKLIEEIQNLIHTYLEVSPFYEKIATHYVLFTWMYDKFNELPYLRAIADFGQGKSRFLKTIGSLCYRPMITMGATTIAPIFRILNQFRGTFILDEADLRYSDTNNDMVKILNVGFQSGTPIFRCSGDDHDVQAFDVFGPKIVATRQKFEDQALESRFLVEKMDSSLTRTDIPISLDSTFEQKALDIRNKCLLWRLENYTKTFVALQIDDRSIEPRLRQILGPLCGVIQDEEIKKELIDFIKKYNIEMREDRGMSDEGQILEVLISLANQTTDDISINELTGGFNQKLKTMNLREISHKKIGMTIRNNFHLQTKRTRDGYIIPRKSYNEQIEKLKIKYDLQGEHVNNVNVPIDDPFVKDLKDIGYFNT